jgi:phosphoglycolate phosphatase
MRITSRCVLFDLDGTLLDTAPDMAGALNELLAERGAPGLAYDRVRPHVSNGSLALIQLGFGIQADDPGFETLRERFLALYLARVARETRLFDGMERLLLRLESAARPWGVVTNKPARLTEPLLEALGLTSRAGAVVSGDSAARSKPHPDPLILASEIIGVPPEECLYIGDARRDIEAGREAGMRTLAAAFGYILPDDPPEQWGADGIVWDPGDIEVWL